MQASARLAASKRVIVDVRSTIARSCYRTSRGKAHAAPLSGQEPPPKGPKRISKQERRVIIEEFVEKYRASNEGKFPTMTCVRRQTGGCHYTVREVLQELEYNHANPPLDKAKSAQGQGTTEFSKHSRSTDVSKAAQVQVSAQFAEHSWPKDDNGKNPDNSEALKNDGQDDSAGTATIKKTEPQRFMGSDNIVQTEDAKPDFSISDSIKNADGITLSDQTESEGMKDLTNEHAMSLGTKSYLGKQEGETKVNKLDFNNTGKSLNASKSTVSDQSGSDKVLKRNMPDSEHGPKHENKGSTETGLLGSLKSFAYGIKNFWKSL